MTKAVGDSENVILKGGVTDGRTIHRHLFQKMGSANGVERREDEMRLIDADALADEMMKSSMPSHDIGGRYQTGFMDARSMVISAPTIDPAENGGCWGCCCEKLGQAEHGKWIKHPGHVVHEEGAFQWKYDDIFECSLCGRKAKEASNYCPACGAKMVVSDEKRRSY